MKKNHKYYEILISRYKDNDLDKNEILEMEKHLALCKSCQKFQNEINSMSSILLGIENIKINKKTKHLFANKKIIASITSIAAALLIFLGISVIYNNKNSNSDLTSMTASLITDYDAKEDDYAPFSSYFDYNIDAENDNQKYAENEILIMSAYMYYMAK
ncbi:zf-HC2 domain-containing protein [uncultured Brachyspira sp.]|uniref:zf-HC2 domain-containing protein n=1 Tax=uncultured Brachyspira sp. TaxID=221953 RepID=UPI0025CE5C85|nr:zf-HC2 domain-containing protein [uncultured Brachyspira sp.]